MPEQSKKIQRIWFHKVPIVDLRILGSISKSKKAALPPSTHVDNCNCPQCRKRKKKLAKMPDAFFFKASDSSPTVICATLQKNGFQLTSSRNWNLMWSSSMLKSHEFSKFHIHQRINQFPRISELVRKDLLTENIERLQTMFKHQVPSTDFLPKTYILPKESALFQEELAMRDKEGDSVPWILKPAAKAQGKDISIHHFTEKSFMCMSLPIGEDNCTVSRYIDNPLLIDGLKWDLRLYVLIASFNPLRVYFHDEGLARFSTEPYSADPKHYNNLFMHLTNYSINKSHPDFKDTSDTKQGHKWTLTGLLSVLEKKGIDSNRLMTSIHDIIVKALLAVKHRISPAVKMFVPNSSSCFQLVGFDVMIDENLKPWLLEANWSPSLNTSSQLDAEVKSKVVSDMLTLIGVPAVDMRKINSLKSSSSKPQRSMKGTFSRTSSKPETPLLFRSSIDSFLETFLATNNLPLTSSDMPGPVIPSVLKKHLNTFERELRRLGGFKCIFPVKSELYLKVLAEDAGIHCMMDQWFTTRKNKSDKPHTPPATRVLNSDSANAKSSPSLLSPHSSKNKKVEKAENSISIKTKDNKSQKSKKNKKTKNQMSPIRSPSKASKLLSMPSPVMERLMAAPLSNEVIQKAKMLRIGGSNGNSNNNNNNNDSPSKPLTRITRLSMNRKRSDRQSAKGIGSNLSNNNNNNNKNENNKDKRTTIRSNSSRKLTDFSPIRASRKSTESAPSNNESGLYGKEDITDVSAIPTPRRPTMEECVQFRPYGRIVPYRVDVEHLGFTCWDESETDDETNKMNNKKNKKKKIISPLAQSTHKSKHSNASSTISSTSATTLNKSKSKKQNSLFLPKILSQPPPKLPK